MFGFDDWTELTKPRDLAKIFDTAEYTKWRGFRDTEDARFVSLAMPRVLARVPYGAATKPVEEFAYEEAPYDATGAAQALDHKEYCWMNAAYAMGARLTDASPNPASASRSAAPRAAARSRTCRPMCSSPTTATWTRKCPTEIGITDRREYELSNLGFLPLCHYKNTDYAVFFGGQTSRSRRSTTARTRPRTRRSPRACPTSWPRAVSPIS